MSAQTAGTLLPVSATRDGFTRADAERLSAQVRVAKLLLSGDVARYRNGHISHFIRTACLPAASGASHAAGQRGAARVRRHRRRVPAGRLPPEAFLAQPEGRAQGYIAGHRGRVVFERCPGLRADDPRLWASFAKPMASLLIDDGLIDEGEPFGRYVPDFRGTGWDDVRVVDLLDKTPGLDTEENDEARSNSATTATRPVVSPAIVERSRRGVRSHVFFINGYDGPVFTQRLNAPIVGNSRQWDAVFADGDIFKSGFMGQALYVSPDRDLVIAAYSTAPDHGCSLLPFLRPIATSGLF